MAWLYVPGFEVSINVCANSLNSLFPADEFIGVSMPK